MPNDWAELDRAHVWHPYTQHAASAAPIGITRAAGAHLFDRAGRRIVDAISSWWVTLHGHCHPTITEAIAHLVSLRHYGCAREGLP